MRNIIIPWMMVLAVNNSQLDNESYRGAYCIANFCMGFHHKLPMRKSALIKTYGKGCIVNEVYHCYFDPEQEIYIQFGVDEEHTNEIDFVFVSGKPSCPCNVRPKIKFPKMVTKEGIGIGNSIKEVLNTYGKPSSIRKPTDQFKADFSNEHSKDTEHFGDTAYFYYNIDKELALFSVFYFRKGKVSAFLISNGE